MKYGKWIFTFLTILWMAAIFTFSARDAQESTEDSNRAGTILCENLIPGFSRWPKERRQELVERIDFPVRKAAHAFEYAVLGALIFMTVMLHAKTPKPGVKCVWTAWLAAVGYAATDELHQYFVPGRACRLFDVAVDGTGALIGIAAVALISYKLAKFNKNLEIFWKI